MRQRYGIIARGGSCQDRAAFHHLMKSSSTYSICSSSLLTQWHCSCCQTVNLPYRFYCSFFCIAIIIIMLRVLFWNECVLLLHNETALIKMWCLWIESSVWSNQKGGWSTSILKPDTKTHNYTHAYTHTCSNTHHKTNTHTGTNIYQTHTRTWHTHTHTHTHRHTQN